MEPYCAFARYRSEARPLAIRAITCLVECGPSRWLHRFLQREIPLQILVAGDGHSSRGHRRKRGETADPTWTPLLPTPPVPDYDSAYAAKGQPRLKYLLAFLAEAISLFPLAAPRCCRGRIVTIPAPSVVRTAVLGMRPMRMACPASWLASISATLSMRV